MHGFLLYMLFGIQHTSRLITEYLNGIERKEKFDVY
jgi:hypothetical protein